MVAVLKHLAYLGLDKVADEAEGGIEAGIEVVGSDQGFRRVCQYRLLGPAAGLLLALAEQDVLVQPSALASSESTSSETT